MSEEKAPGPTSVRGDNADEVIRLRDELYDQERQTGRWVNEAASQERRADALGHALRMALAFIEQVRDGAYGDLAGLDAQQALDEIGTP